MGRKPVWRKIKVMRMISAKEMFEGVVRDFGTGGAHIPFSVDYRNKKVLVIPLEKSDNV